MHPKRLEIQQRLRWLIPACIALGVVFIVALWVRYVTLSNAGLDSSARDVWHRPIVWLALALIATVVAPPMVFVATRNYVWLIRHGAEVTGRVVSVSSLTHGGSRPVTYAYKVGGVEHTIKRDTPNESANRYVPGTPVLVLVDPNHPKRATVLDVED